MQPPHGGTPSSPEPPSPTSDLLNSPKNPDPVTGSLPAQWLVQEPNADGWGVPALQGLPYLAAGGQQPEPPPKAQGGWLLLPSQCGGKGRLGSSVAGNEVTGLGPGKESPPLGSCAPPCVEAHPSMA